MADWREGCGRGGGKGVAMIIVEAVRRAAMSRSRAVLAPNPTAEDLETSARTNELVISSQLHDPMS